MDDNSRIRKYKLPQIIPAILLIAALLISNVWVLWIMGVAVYVVLFAMERESRQALSIRLSVIFLFVLMGCLPLLFNRASSSSYWQWGGWGIDPQSVRAFTLVALRCADAVGAVLLFIQWTPIYQFCAELRTTRFPRLLIDLFELTYRYIFVLEETIHHIATAQVSRMGYVGWRAQMKDTGLLIAQTLILTHNEADHLYDGLVSRGYEDDPEDDITTPETAEGEALLTLSGIDFGYEKDRPILKHVDLTIQGGERIALLGENGAGKSTLFLLLNGILKHESGIYNLHGTDIGNSKNDMRTIRRAVSLVFQNSNHQLFTPSVYDEVAYGLKNIGFKGDELDQRVQKVLDDFELQDVKHFPPHKLSEGRKKWVAIAAVLATDPEIIILDEPTSNLDRYYTNKVLELLNKLHGEGKTIIISTHDMNLAHQWAERVLVMHQGELIADDSTEIIFSQPELLDRANLETPYACHPPVHSRQNSSGVGEHFHLPIFMDATALRCLVVGAGVGATRKVQTLLQAGAICTVIAPKSSDHIAQLTESQRITYEQRTYRAGDSRGYAMVVAATDDAELNSRICAEAASEGILFLSLSDPKCANFHFAASAFRGGVGLAIHTEYRLPEVARLLKDHFAASLPTDMEDKMKKLNALRTARQEEEGDHEALNQEYDDILSQIDRLLNKL